MSRIPLLLAAALATVLSGCASLVNRASGQLADNLTIGILDQDDPATARDGIPSWLLLVDGLINGNPGNAGLLESGARLYGAYAGLVFTPIHNLVASRCH